MFFFLLRKNIFYYLRYNRTLEESLSCISGDITRSIAPPGDDVYTRNWHLCDLMRVSSLFFCFSRCSEATSHKCSGVYLQGWERSSAMQVRTFAISYTNVNCFLRAQSSHNVSSSAFYQIIMVHYLTNVILVIVSPREKETVSNPGTVFYYVILANILAERYIVSARSDLMQITVADH